MKMILTTLTLFVGIQAFGQSNAESEILALSKQKAEWMLAGNTESLTKLLDDKMLLIHASGRTQTKEEYLDDLKAKRLVYNVIDFKEGSVRVFDNTAVIVGKAHFKITVNNMNPSFDFSYTEVYVKKKDKWKMILYGVQKPMEAPQQK